MGQKGGNEQHNKNMQSNEGIEKTCHATAKV